MDMPYFFLVIGLCTFILWTLLKDRHSVKKQILSGRFVSHKGYLKKWEDIRGGVVSGCYVILIFDRPVTKNFRGYKEVYIGQSINVRRRVYNHFTGSGNGDVYADIKYGKYAYVQIIECSKKLLNRTEKQLIEEFGATKSYNKTKGGAKAQK